MIGAMCNKFQGRIFTMRYEHQMKGSKLHLIVLQNFGQPYDIQQTSKKDIHSRIEARFLFNLIS
jgi:hypothetical protein